MDTYLILYLLLAVAGTLAYNYAGYLKLGNQKVKPSTGPNGSTPSSQAAA
jgi:hypothetical protein